MSNTPHPAATIATALAHWDRHGVLSPEDIATIASRVYRLASCENSKILAQVFYKMGFKYPPLEFNFDAENLHIFEALDQNRWIVSISRKIDR